MLVYGSTSLISGIIRGILCLSRLIKGHYWKWCCLITMCECILWMWSDCYFCTYFGPLPHILCLWLSYCIYQFELLVNVCTESLLLAAVRSALLFQHIWGLNPSPGLRLVGNDGNYMFTLLFVNNCGWCSSFFLILFLGSLCRRPSPHLQQNIRLSLKGLRSAWNLFPFPLVSEYLSHEASPSLLTLLAMP